ncbi:hypothetical protein ACVH9Z_36030 [Rhodococcus opacus]|jgi:hypothetical protein|uniref:Secreted protein n=2 Tax=Rhodococcus TaxID=1827 RepID=A0A1B1KEE7_RHOOP|nr:MULTISPECIES: hypothetical protein [Rhodococcus]NHU43660.1 hypothetical protein [Rhodococcus sp. A14]ANS30981.1 hypothetical protein R1CP_31785 [Rhodococcus opacus]MDH6292945.1 hypothetical protein [Rhodococcus opacus]MDI9939719.1 hypothetical protein [Rhodococcus sp. IEGM 1351]MDI9974403.1 hypothetical protein [Rhodococcus sp. IEGM 1307]
MNKQLGRRVCAAALTAVGLGTAVATGGGAVASAQPAPPTSTTMTCSSANPLVWAPPFTWTINAASGESLRPGGSALEPAILLSGGNELPTPPGGLIPSIGVNWYGTRVSVDWHNTTTGATGHSVSDEAAWQQKPGIPINRTWTGTGTVAFTVTVQTGAGWWFVNSQNAVCQGTISVVPGR